MNEENVELVKRAIKVSVMLLNKNMNDTADMLNVDREWVYEEFLRELAKVRGKNNGNSKTE